MAMDTTSAAFGTAVIVTAGQWAKDGKGPSIKVIVGMLFLAYFLTLMSQGNPKLASQFAVLILVGALITYTIPITNKLGLTDVKGGKKK